jgi:hypothetical protein
MLFLLFWIFCTTLLNQVGHTLFNSEFKICKYEGARILFDDVGLDSKLQHSGTCKVS